MIWNRSQQTLIRQPLARIGKKVQTWLREISRLFNPPWLRLELPLVDPEQAARLTGIAPLVAGFVETIRENWSLSQIHANSGPGDFWTILANMCSAWPIFVRLWPVAMRSRPRDKAWMRSFNGYSDTNLNCSSHLTVK